MRTALAALFAGAMILIPIWTSQAAPAGLIGLADGDILGSYAVRQATPWGTSTSPMP